MRRFAVLAAFISFTSPALARHHQYAELRDYFDQQRMTMFCAASGLVDEDWLAAMEWAIEGVLRESDPTVAQAALGDSNVYFRSRTVPKLRRLSRTELESACLEMKQHSIEDLGIGRE